MARGELLTDADAQYIERIWADCEVALGPQTELLDLRHEPYNHGVRLAVRYRLGNRERESEAVGENLLAAHAELRAKMVFDRIRYGTSDIFSRGW